MTESGDEIIKIDALDIVDATHVGLTETDNFRIILTSLGHHFGINRKDTREFIGTARSPTFFASVKYAGGDDTCTI